MPAAITYENGIEDLPGWMPGSLADQPLGYAYEYGGHFVHLFGRDCGLWVISSGLTFYEKADGALGDWTTRVFAAKNSKTMRLDAGSVIEGVWRPGLYWEDQIFQALRTDRVERRAAEQALYGLVERLNELLLYIEPEAAGLKAYGPRSRELLILACTEVENTWTHYMRRSGAAIPKNGFKTSNYVKLAAPLCLAEYEIKLAPYAYAPAVRPFNGWSAGAPTQSIPWYDAYNKTKHDRALHLPEATLERCIEAVAASVIMFCVRFGPVSLYQPSTPLASLANHLFTIELVDCDPVTFYVPLIELPSDHYFTGLGSGDSQSFTKPWSIQPLSL
jgi:hypothetical protein